MLIKATAPLAVCRVVVDLRLVQGKGGPLKLSWSYPATCYSAGVGTTDSVKAADGVLDIDFSVPLHKVWAEMEKLVAEGLVRSIGIR